MGAPTTPATVTPASTRPRVPARLSTKPLSSAWPRLDRYSMSTGTKAREKAPSANSRRMKLGILKATKKASVAASAPNTRAITRSRMNPRTRESKVLPPTLAAAPEIEAKKTRSRKSADYHRKRRARRNPPIAAAARRCLNRPPSGRR